MRSWAPSVTRFSGIRVSEDDEEVGHEPAQPDLHRRGNHRRGRGHLLPQNVETAPSRSPTPHGFLAESSGMPSLPARSGQKWPDSQLRRHEPHQTPGERLFQRLAIEILFLARVQRHHPARMVDGPGAIAAARGDRCSQDILQGAAVQGRVHAGLGEGASEIPCQHRAILYAWAGRGEPDPVPARRRRASAAAAALCASPACCPCASSAWRSAPLPPSRAPRAVPPPSGRAGARSRATAARLDFRSRAHWRIVWLNEPCYRMVDGRMCIWLRYLATVRRAMRMP
jgi:hypothetical protein